MNASYHNNRYKLKSRLENLAFQMRFSVRLTSAFKQENERKLEFYYRLFTTELWPSYTARFVYPS